MGGQVTGTPERLSPWPGHRALAATCLLSARVPGLTGGGMGPRWAGLEDRVRARYKSFPLSGPQFPWWLKTIRTEAFKLFLSHRILFLKKIQILDRSPKQETHT